MSNPKNDKWQEHGLVDPYANPDAIDETEDEQTKAAEEYQAKIDRIPTAVATSITPESASERVRRSWRKRYNQRKGVRPKGTTKRK